MMSLYAEVALALPLCRTFSYEVPSSLKKKAAVGTRVLVPFHNRVLTGFIVGLQKEPPDVSFVLKTIRKVLDDTPLFSGDFLDFTRRTSAYFYSSWGEMLQASLPPSFSVKSRTRVSVTDEGMKDKRGLSDAEKKLLLFLGKKSYTPVYIQRKFPGLNTAAVLARLKRRGLIDFERKIDKTRKRRVKKEPDHLTQMELDFLPDERIRKWAREPEEALEKEKFSRFYVFGDPVQRLNLYLALIRKTLERKKKTLFLVPEIRLTESLVRMLEKRLGRGAAVLHGRMPERTRENEWRRIKEGKVDIVVGARSAVLSPLSRLGLVVVDEEQDESYIQSENPAYDAGTAALFRAEKSRAVLLFGSDVPSVSRYFFAEKKGGLLRLDRAAVPEAHISDYDKKKGWISSFLMTKIKSVLKREGRILVFSNRRGYASFLFCAQCDFVARCGRCDAALTYHKEPKRMVCHYCRSSRPEITRCPECGGRIVLGGGCGSETLQEEIQALFPAARVARFDSDTAAAVPDRERILRRFYQGRVDILVGTPLLLREPNLPNIDLLAALFPERLLMRPDFRAGEKTYAVLSRLISLLGNQGEAVIQTSSPDHFSIRYAAVRDYEGFVREELRFRRLMNDPPYTSMVEVILQGGNLRDAARKSRDFISAVKRKAGRKIEIFGPAMAPVGKIRGRSRIQVLFKADNKAVLDDVLTDVLPALSVKKSIRVYDV